MYVQSIPPHCNRFKLTAGGAQADAERMKKSTWLKLRRIEMLYRLDALQRKISSLIARKVVTTAEVREAMRRGREQDDGVEKNGHRSRAGRAD